MANERARGLGYKFVTDDKYLIDPFSPTDGISYEGDGSPVSYANSGIMTQAPIPAPLTYIPQNEGGGGGEGDDDDDDENTTNAGITSKMDIAKNVLGFMMNPMAFGLTKAYQGYRQKKEKQELQDFYNTTEAKTAQDMARDNKAGNTGGYQAGYDRGFMDGPSGAGRGNAPGDKGGSDSMGSHADGGRVGYFFGGRVNYKAGGRINFKGGGMDASSGDFGGGNTPGPGDTGGEGGNNPSDDSDRQFGGGNNNDGNNNPPPINKTSIIDKIRYNPIINNPLTRLVGRVGMYSINPSLMGLDYRTASQLKGVYDKATDEVDEDDVTLNKYKQGGRVGFKNGGLASIL